jgi:S-adenosylmethionine:tRNA ribosyltransferase-isomerase
MHPGNLEISDFTYILPDEKIAAFPSVERDLSRLLVYKAGRISEDIYRNIHLHLPEQSLLVFNNTKVVPARITFLKPTGGMIEIFCLEPGEQFKDVTTAMSATGSVQWKCLVGGASKWKTGQLLEKKFGSGLLHAKYIEKKEDHFIIELNWEPSSLSFAEILQLTGAIPLPPYIKRETEMSDRERYQTVYAEPEGSVAAPTAGLHFTEKIFNSLKQKNINSEFLTLHVGAGTFKPVKAERMHEHVMHSEWIDVSKASILNIINHIDCVIAVGTTSLRTLESLYWIGVNLRVNQSLKPITQWEAYSEDNVDLMAIEALQEIINWMENNNSDRIITKTSIIIAPGYKTRIVKALITNFHQPGSTLLLLVAALIGDDWRKVYDYALNNDFRFLSYGDGSLLWTK